MHTCFTSALECWSCEHVAKDFFRLVSASILLLFVAIIIVSCLSFSPACKSVHYVQCPQKKEKLDLPGAGVTDGRELSRRCWELNQSSLEEQPALLTMKRSLWQSDKLADSEVLKQITSVFLYVHFDLTLMPLKYV